jgi:hypothetical protein
MHCTRHMYFAVGIGALMREDGHCKRGLRLNTRSSLLVLTSAIILISI